MATVAEAHLPPGPAWPAAAQTAAWIGAPGRFLRSCLDRYGPAFTLSFSGEGPAVWLAEPDDVRAVFSAAPGTADAGAVNWQLAPALGARSVLLLDGPDHLDVRRLLSAPFHGARLAGWTQTIAECAARDCERWPAGEPFALRPRMQAITLDAILRVVIGSPSPSLHRALTQWLTVAASPLALVPAFRRQRTPADPVRPVRGRPRARARAVARRVVAAPRDGHRGRGRAGCAGGLFPR